MPKMSFNSTVSARTKCAIAILGDERIRDVGFTAEAANLTALRADRSAKKGGAKTSTAEERAAVEQQSLLWGTKYRLLAALAAR